MKARGGRWRVADPDVGKRLLAETVVPSGDFNLAEPDGWWVQPISAYVREADELAVARYG